jgi:hypothetical protein
LYRQLRVEKEKIELVAWMGVGSQEMRRRVRKLGEESVRDASYS